MGGVPVQTNGEQDPEAVTGTIIRYDRARKNLDRHPYYILAAYMASGTDPTLPTCGRFG